MSDKELRFQRFLDGELSREERQQFEQDVADDELLSARLATAMAATHQADHYEQQEVPNWDRGATFESERTPWWQWQGLPAMSMAFSMAAMCLVIFNVQFVANDDGFAVTFGDQSAKQRQWMEQQIVQVRLDQQDAMSNFTQVVAQQQKDSQFELVSYLMSTSRDERRQEISDVIRYVNQQRTEDNQFIQNEFRQLQKTVYTQDEPIQLQRSTQREFSPEQE